jgi:hypothetical protein
MNTLARLTVLVSVTLTAPALAQHAVPGGHVHSGGHVHHSGHFHAFGHHGHHHGVVFPHGFGFGFGATTAFESFARGKADLIRARGESNVLNSQALQNLEEARSRALDNEVKELATRQEKQRMGQARLAAEAEQRKADHERYLANHERLERTGDGAATVEKRAASRLQLARKLIENGKTATARGWLTGLVEQYPETDAALAAAELLASLN